MIHDVFHLLGCSMCFRRTPAVPWLDETACRCQRPPFDTAVSSTASLLISCLHLCYNSRVLKSPSIALDVCFSWWLYQGLPVYYDALLLEHTHCSIFWKYWPRFYYVMFLFFPDKFFMPDKFWKLLCLTLILLPPRSLINVITKGIQTHIYFTSLILFVFISK